jgi:hypothetical protein
VSLNAEAYKANPTIHTIKSVESRTSAAQQSGQKVASVSKLSSSAQANKLQDLETGSPVIFSSQKKASSSRYSMMSERSSKTPTSRALKNSKSRLFSSSQLAGVKRTHKNKQIMLEKRAKTPEKTVKHLQTQKLLSMDLPIKMKHLMSNT